MVSRRTFLSAAGLATGSAATVWLDPTAPSAAAGGHGGRSGLSWRRGRLLPRFARPKQLQIADIEPLTGDEQLLLGTLQGIVNRHRPELYFYYDQADRAWPEVLDVPQRTVSDPLSLLDDYLECAAGAVVYDPDVRESINVATTLAGLRGAVVASPDLAQAHGLDVVEDLRGQFTGWSKVDVYRWQLEQLWPDCEQRLITGLPPTRVVEVDDVTWREVARESEQVRDESNRGFYTLDLSPDLGDEAVYVRFGDAFDNDGWGASVVSVSVVADGVEISSFTPGSPEEAEHLLEGGGSSVGGQNNRFADGGNFFVYRVAPPEGTQSLQLVVEMWNQYVVSATTTAPIRVEPFTIFRDYVVATQAMVVWLDPNGEEGELLTEIMADTRATTPYLGWFSNDVAGEWGGVDLAATQSVEVLPADYFANGSVLGGVPARIDSRPPRVSRRSLENTVYVTMTVGEGDNLQYCQRYMRTLWDDPARGEAPTNWTISPVLADAAPSIYRYYQQTATENDLLICGPSGAGYTYGGSWPEADFDAYTALTGRYLKETGLDLVYAYNNRDDEGWIPIGGTVLDSYRRNTELRGIFQSWEGGGVIAGAPLPVVGHLNAPGDGAEYKAALDDYIADWDGTRPWFVSAGILAWNQGPAEIAELHRLLVEDGRYTVVLGNTFFDLLHGVEDPQPPAAERG